MHGQVCDRLVTQRYDLFYFGYEYGHAHQLVDPACPHAGHQQSPHLQGCALGPPLGRRQYLGPRAVGPASSSRVRPYEYQ